MEEEKESIAEEVVKKNTIEEAIDDKSENTSAKNESTGETPSTTEKQNQRDLMTLLRDWRFLIFFITALAILMRTLPLLLYSAWGSDVGIYYGITKEFIATGQFYSPYSGWGSSYNYFPVLYALVGGLHNLTGIDTLSILLSIGPIFGGLTVTAVYFIARSVGLKQRASLAAAAILAVFPVHAYQTSHAAPLVMGHFFLVLSFLFFIRSHKDRRYIGPMYMCTIMLILSHHLSTYMYIISIMSVIFWQNIWSRKWTDNMMEYVVYILATLTFTFGYWAYVATPVYRGFMEGATPFGSFSIVSIAYIVFIISLFIIWIKRRYFPDAWMIQKHDGLAEWKRDSTMFIIATIGTIALASFGSLGITGRLSGTFFLWSIPMGLIVGFGAIGWFYTKRGYIHGWAFVLMLSSLYSFISRSKVLLPERHMEYIAEPLAIIAGLGLVTTAHEMKKHKNLPLMVLIVALLAVNATSITLIYASPGGGAEYTREVTTYADMNAIDWINNNVPNQTVIAGDHLISLLLWADNYTLCNEFIEQLWTDEDWVTAMGELNGSSSNYTCDLVEYVFLDNIMFRDGVKTTASVRPLEMTNESYSKFSLDPFELVYRNVTREENDTFLQQMATLDVPHIDHMDLFNESQMMNVLEWTEIYSVNWTYINSYIP